MTMGSERLDQLLFATLAGTNGPQTSDSLLDLAMGAALSNGWTPAQTKLLTRRLVAARLQRLEKTGYVRRSGSDIDGRARRTTPTYVVANVNAPTHIPPPPAAEAGSWQAHAPTITSSLMGASMDVAQLSRDQITVLLDGHDQMLDTVSRFLADLSSTREKVRQRLIAAGLGEHG